MSKLRFIVNCLILIVVLHSQVSAESEGDNKAKQPIVITSETLVADNLKNLAVFSGSVVAKTDEITIYSDKMTVFYNNDQKKINRIKAAGNVKVLQKETTIFSDEALYIEKEEKIVFTGNPKVVEADNVITGSTIHFFLKDERAVVKDSRVILQSERGLK